MPTALHHPCCIGGGGGWGGLDWVVLQHEGGVEDDEVAIRVDQYLVVFLVSLLVF